MAPISPCPHTGPCPMTGLGRSAWCHFTFPAAPAPGLAHEFVGPGRAAQRSSLSLSFNPHVQGARTLRPAGCAWSPRPFPCPAARASTAAPTGAWCSRCGPTTRPRRSRAASSRPCGPTRRSRTPSPGPWSCRCITARKADSEDNRPGPDLLRRGRGPATGAGGRSARRGRGHPCTCWSTTRSSPWGRHGGAENLLINEDFLAKRGRGPAPHRPAAAWPPATSPANWWPTSCSGWTNGPAGCANSSTTCSRRPLPRPRSSPSPPHARQGYPGAWVEKRKLCSVGAAVKRWVSYHGLALNVGPDLSLFDLITPCGIQGVRMTSLSLEAGREITVEDAKHVFQRTLPPTITSHCASRPGCAPRLPDGASYGGTAKLLEDLGPAHGLPGSPVPQPLGVLLPAYGHLPGAGAGMHAQLRLLQRHARPTGRPGPGRARARGRGRPAAEAQARGHHLGHPGRFARRRCGPFRVLHPRGPKGPAKSHGGSAHPGLPGRRGGPERGAGSQTRSSEPQPGDRGPSSIRASGPRPRTNAAWNCLSPGAGPLRTSMGACWSKAGSWPGWASPFPGS